MPAIINSPFFVFKSLTPFSIAFFLDGISNGFDEDSIRILLISDGFSFLGLSSVIIWMSVYLDAIFAILVLLVLSLSPPQPKIIILWSISFGRLDNKFSKASLVWA